MGCTSSRVEVCEVSYSLSTKENTITHFCISPPPGTSFLIAAFLNAAPGIVRQFFNSSNFESVQFSSLKNSGHKLKRDPTQEEGTWKMKNLSNL